VDFYLLGNATYEKQRIIMRLSVTGKGVRIGDKLYSDIDRRLKFALGRFGTEIHQVTVRVADSNGPRGGADKECRITIALRGTGSDYITVAYSADNLYAAIVRASQRAQRAVVRAIERKRTMFTYHRRRAVDEHPV
jgi:ribosome hibernation promoting factor